VNDDDVRALLREEIEKAGSLRKWAMAHGISPAWVSQMMNHHRPPGPKIMKALGIEAQRLYRRRKK